MRSFLPLRRQKVEGWEVDVDDTQGMRLREKLGNNGKLWFVCLLVIVAGTIYYAVSVQGGYSGAPVSAVKLGGVAQGSATDDAHNALIEDLVRMARKRSVTLTARFNDVNTLEMIVPSDTSADEMSFLSRFAATANYRKFSNVPIVYVYTTNSVDSNEEPRLTAITRWSERERNFVAKFQRSVESETGT